MTFEQIAKANESIRTMSIRGREYAEVNQRIKAFRMVYPQGRIMTSIFHLGDGEVVMMAEVSDEQGHILGTGTAHEKESSSFINKTSYIENCETSAVGRALGMCGFGIDTSVASAEEVENAILNQGKEEIHVCENCGSEITDGRKNDGSVWSAKDIAAYTARKFGKELCTECAKKESSK
jgi:hypothetical protein